MNTGKPSELESEDGLTAIVRTPRSTQVQIQIETAISQGRFLPGERLPSERKLVETFGVSRVSIREALRSLEALGVVHVQQGRGAFVSDRRSGLGEPLVRWLALHRDEVFDLHLVRGALDELAAQSAAERHDDGEIERLRAAHEALRLRSEQGAPVEELMRLDLEFHLALAEGSGSRLLYDLLSELHMLLAEARRFSFSTDGRPAISVEEHAAIVDGVSRGDAAAARSAMRTHVEAIRKITARLISDEANGRPSE